MKLKSLPSVYFVACLINHLSTVLTLSMCKVQSSEHKKFMYNKIMVKYVTVNFNVILVYTILACFPSIFTFTVTLEFLLCNHESN